MSQRGKWWVTWLALLLEEVLAGVRENTSIQQLMETQLMGRLMGQGGTERLTWLALDLEQPLEGRLTGCLTGQRGKGWVTRQALVLEELLGVQPAGVREEGAAAAAGETAVGTPDGAARGRELDMAGTDEHPAAGGKAGR